MERRESIKRISSFLGLATSLTSLAGILEGCSEKKDPLWAPLKLNKKQRALISVFADLIIPPTDTPGATDAGVPAFIEILLMDVFQVKDARDLLHEMEDFNQDCQAVTGYEFMECSPEQQRVWMKEVIDSSHRDHAIFEKMKELVVGAYFTSEVGIKQNLDYTPIPGKFEACRKMGEHDKIMVGDRL
ncbi:MAG: gluconate 2-dehydrogenase subunit 3 family protein [Cyclobacteriaceae bacterium]|nr:gluconate 2-dehydrogenase subunit 3 family protein [Cyclobacteriaceae bacterium]